MERTMNRVEHVLFGTGTVIEPRTTEGGRAAYLVRFDGTETDRLILADSLKPSSSAPVDSGETPKKGRKKAAPPAEAVSDQLLVPELDKPLAEPDPERSEEIEAVEAM
jgi:hypothetical protein